jgi:hypothetical protein
MVRTLLVWPPKIGYASPMKQMIAIICLILLGLSLGGCTKCGWIWNEAPRSCHSDSPRT